MWMLSFIPDSLIAVIVHVIFAIGVIGFFIGSLASILPFISVYGKVIKNVAGVLLIVGLYLEGGLGVEQDWRKKVAEMEAKVALAEQQSVKENVRIVEKIVKQTEYIKTRGKDIVKYVDREVVKYDTKFASGGQCEIPKEFIKALNAAAEMPK
jgi:hypothetical protein